MTETTTPSPFVWDGDYKNQEQVRPYMDGYRAVLAELTAAGQYPYNDSFKGRIPGLSGSEREDTGIYMCQNLNSVDALATKTEAFLAAGGYELDSGGLGDRPLRGIVVKSGFYVGGTGWEEREGRLVRHHTEIAVMAPRARTRGHLMGREVLFMPAGPLADAWRDNEARKIVA